MSAKIVLSFNLFYQFFMVEILVLMVEMLLIIDV